MHRFITKIGKGRRGAKDLTWEDAKYVAGELIEGRATPYQVGAFLMAMRIKVETVTELAALTVVTRSYAPPLRAPEGLVITDVPVYAEKHNTSHVCIPAAIVAASAGARILFHGADSPSVAADLPRIFSWLGIPAQLQGDDLMASLERGGVAYLDIALYHPPLATFLVLRESLGAQNMFHQVARLLNPARAASQVIGVAHPQYVEKIPEVVSMLGGDRLLVFQGLEGFPELSLTAPTVMRERRQDRITPLTLTPRNVQLSPGTFQQMALPESPAPDVPALEAERIRNILHNRNARDHTRVRDWVIYNAATLLYAAGRAPSIAAGVPMARHGLESGDAARTLDTLATLPLPAAAPTPTPAPATATDAAATVDATTTDAAPATTVHA